jgi:hypothetical protein
MAKLEEKPRKFLDESPHVGVATTLREDGSPHSVGKDEYPWRNPEETRVKVLIEPEKVDASGFE